MIVMQINGDVAYPDTSQNIKVTYENQFVKDSGSYTYEVQFPMAILENKMIFKNVDRFDVSKKLATYDDCKLYVDNRLVISGKGTVTNITNSVVKLQIVGGKSRIKYNSKFGDTISMRLTILQSSSIQASRRACMTMPASVIPIWTTINGCFSQTSPLPTT